MPIYVAKISRHDEGTNAYAFEAAHDEDANNVANELVDITYAETLDEVMLIEDFLNGSTYELCST